MDADYVVVGAGSAGCVVAARLSETGAQVILLEAGPRDTLPWIHIPAGVLKLLHHPVVNWNYSAEGPQDRRNPLAARQDPGRIKFDQRDAVCARQSSRFRRLGADGLPWLELRRRSAVLPQIRGLQARRRPGIPRQGRPAESRRLPHHSSADAQIHRSRAAGGVQVQQRPQRPAARRRRLLTDDPQGTMARLNRTDIPPRGRARRKPARGNRGIGHADCCSTANAAPASHSASAARRSRRVRTRRSSCAAGRSTRRICCKSPAWDRRSICNRSV